MAVAPATASDPLPVQDHTPYHCCNRPAKGDLCTPRHPRTPNPPSPPRNLPPTCPSRQRPVIPRTPNPPSPPRNLPPTVAQRPSPHPHATPQPSRPQRPVIPRTPNPPSPPRNLPPTCPSRQRPVIPRTPNPPSPPRDLPQRARRGSDPPRQQSNRKATPKLPVRLPKQSINPFCTFQLQETQKKTWTITQATTIRPAPPPRCAGRRVGVSCRRAG